MGVNKKIRSIDWEMKRLEEEFRNGFKEKYGTKKPANELSSEDLENLKGMKLEEI